VLSNSVFVFLSSSPGNAADNIEIQKAIQAQYCESNAICGGAGIKILKAALGG